MSFDVEYEIRGIKKRLDTLEMDMQQAEYALNEFRDFKEVFLKEYDKLVDLISGFRDNLRDS